MTIIQFISIRVYLRANSTTLIIQFNSIQFFIINVPSQQQTPITETAQCVYNIT
jgi:hypothetical protein